MRRSPTIRRSVRSRAIASLLRLTILLVVAARPAHAQGLMVNPPGIPMTRDGSGTSWLPDDSPMRAWHKMPGSWLLMLHTNTFLHYVNEGSARGSSQLGSTNWVMGMARHALAGGNASFRVMLSAEPATVGKCGYPDLIASGEQCNGAPLHDRQHPHDLFMEVVGDYQRAIGKGLAFQLYGGPVGEPALGPVAFPHRVSAAIDPFAPISHHWLDGTHIAFGVVTAGLYGIRWKVEGSLFNGREPDDSRYNIDLERIDSFSGRIWFLPTKAWAFQTSVGRLRAVENERLTGLPFDVTRATASASYQSPPGSAGDLSVTLAWGANVEPDRTTHAAMAEGMLTLHQRNAVFVRMEFTQKTGRDLLPVFPVSALQEAVFAVAKGQLGYSYELSPVLGFSPGIGFSTSVSLIPSGLAQYYGTRVARGFAIVGSIRPPRMAM